VWHVAHSELPTNCARSGTFFVGHHLAAAIRSSVVSEISFLRD
jgi:hypothetical protein